jgi:hypothetical protein
MSAATTHQAGIVASLPSQLIPLVVCCLMCISTTVGLKKRKDFSEQYKVVIQKTCQTYFFCWFFQHFHVANLVCHAISGTFG